MYQNALIEKDNKYIKFLENTENNKARLAFSIASGKVEVSRHSERVISAMKYRIFEVCQTELMDFVDSNEKEDLLIEDIISILETLFNFFKI